MNRILFAMVGVMVGSAAAAPGELPDFDTLWDWQNIAETEATFRELLPAAEASGDASYHLQLLTQLARTLGLQGKFEEAHRVLDQVEQALTDDLELARIRYLLEGGRILNSSGNPDASRPLFREALSRARASGEDYYAIDAAHMMGIVEPPEKQLEWSVLAMGLAERSADERARRWLGPLYHNTGMTYLDLGEYDKALVLFEKDWHHRLDGGGPVEIRIAKWCVGHALRKLGRIDEALALQREIEREVSQEEQPDGYVFEEIAECLLVQGKQGEAQPYFKRAYELLRDKAWIKESEPERLERLKRLADGS
jgi:tetratricopeptide (TPR) repeat protein